jgi:hypothetical protein
VGKSLLKCGGESLNSEEIVQNATNELKEDFRKNRDCFFNEHDLHHVFFCKLSQLGNLVRPEYPTRRRFSADKEDSKEYISGKHSFPPRGENVPKRSRRGHYDFAILDEEFYSEFKGLNDRFERLSSKNVDTNLDQEGRKYVDIVIEFKYINGPCQRENIEFSIFKLKEAEEVRKKIFLVFIRKEGMSPERYEKIINFLNRMKEESKLEINMEIIEHDDDRQVLF